KAEKKRNFDPAEYARKKETFGVIVFESDQDLSAKTIYLRYEDRWTLELVFARYKSDERLDKTNVQEDFSLIGSEFINFISTVATCRVLRKARALGLMAGLSYGELMDDLSSAWRIKDAPEPPSRGDAFWVHTLNDVFDELEALGLSTPAPKPIPKKRGRPKKDTEERKTKRPRGRPKKNPD
ncbi:MAG: transposase, partial [Deltaproteobacteria bacterium]|nr:transposase [Deltaproteobacteria bacterium]